MCRPRFTLAAGLSAVACLAVAVLWVRSHRPPVTRPARGAAPAAAAPHAVTLTPVAAAEVKGIARTQGITTYRLRVGVKSNGASGTFSYLLDITEDKPAPTDEVHESQGVTVVVDEKSSVYLWGTVVDFQEDDRGKGFVFRNPNAK